MEHIIFGGLIVIIIILLIFTLVPLPLINKTNNGSVEMKGPYNIHTSTTLIKNTNFLTNSSVTFQGFLNLEQLQKTGIATPCSSTDHSLPNCDTGRYSLCSCDGNDCTPCYHKGYIPLINFHDICVLEAFGAPDGGRQGQATVQFTIKTQSSGDIQGTKNPELHPKESTGSSSDSLQSDIYLETFILPPLPFQKWIMITISREGRRFDFYYNDKLVLSKQTSTVLYNSPLSSSIRVGDSRLNGSSGFFTLYNSIQTASEIHKQYITFTTTRGSPIFDVNPDLGLTNASLERIPGMKLSLPNVCSSGNCLDSPTNPPSLPYYEWSSSYA